MSQGTRIFDTPNTIVRVVDGSDPQAGGACHDYVITDLDENVLGAVSFQNGPIGEKGVNGIQHVDLLAIVRHRLDSFQGGPFASPVNEVTCGLVSAAIASEDTRTRRRSLAGVEGTNVKAPGVESVVALDPRQG